MIYGTDNRGRLFSKTKGIGETNFEIILGKDGERRNKLMKKEIIESLKLLNKRILVFSKSVSNYLLEDEYKYDIRFFNDANYLEGIDKNLKLLKDKNKNVYIYIDDAQTFKSVVKEMYNLRHLNNFTTVASSSLNVFEDETFSLMLRDKNIQITILDTKKEDYYSAMKIMEKDMTINIDFSNIIDLKLQDMTDAIFIVNTNINNGYLELFETSYLEKEYRDYFKERTFPNLKGPRMENGIWI